MDEDLMKKISDILAEKNINLNDIVDNLNTSDTSKSINDNSNINTDSILKFQKLAKLLSQNETSNDEYLLRALKPYMRSSRKEKIDQYIKILHIINILDKFQEMGGNLNEFL